jgi:putative colanic acid biosynthesis glycosyltransferase
MDGSSNDGTMEFLKTLSEPFYWKSNPDTGVYDAMNKGISLSKSKWLYFLGSDDKLYNENVLESIFSKEENDPYEMIIGKIKYDWNKNYSVFNKFKNGFVSSTWSKKIWIKNTLHHQSVFYRKDLFLSDNYSLKYKILSDYAFNLKLFKKRKKAKIIKDIIAECGTNGISKKYNWNLYKEEIQLKTMESSLLLKPFFILICSFKFLIKNLI